MAAVDYEKHQARQVCQPMGQEFLKSTLICPVSTNNVAWPVHSLIMHGNNTDTHHV